MVEEKIRFRKVRDFGENFNDTFVFIKQNLKPLLLSFFAICGVFMLGKAIFGGIYESHSFGILDQFRLRANRGENAFSSIFTPEYFIYMLFSLVAYVAMKVVLAAYIKYYVDNDGAQPSIEDVWHYFRKYFFRILIYSVPVFLLIVIGCFFCVLPGIYLAVVFVPFDIILVMEDCSFSDAFSRCFTLIKENFWISFAIYFIATLIYSFGSGIISVVVGLIVGAATYVTTKSIGTTAGIVTSFLNLFAGVFYIIFFVSSALQYFNLVEQHDGTGILQQIESLGNDQGNINKTDSGEEY
jgi:hypothetical protein